ncbi:Putative uncharacterized protein [Taphrina deformans PYCC 5710]|uniref:Clathrin/coatomer adaptor adaptin-like N-terminal domain-containing protein n=1 Tax=Taphrina deformans (strain PYCC 5710 / ATCC 11124 / CBS 356.35 / IMI 108563 / JCM 9778 / NBRC 8474) TaxID=1097556 RepID=R4X9P3_TAPDE|nr:Putative uncharacterized protein [Taphrina deformans PYCC 5710]|eukprot:CCG82155.1 Putative uncharacterized protein [Taphrina deformans PYCC 5710]
MSADMISSRAMQWASKVQSIADQARDLTLEAAQSVGARYADETRGADVGKLLEGRTDREKIDGMRRTIAISSKGIDMSSHFASVVKNVASSNLELRKLVYIYITRYAESQPDLALLSINTIQKALSDQNQIVRALALRVISSIRVVSISGIVLLSIKKCMTDSSFYVRKTTAMAISKTDALDPTLHPQLIDCLKVLLSDSNPSVLSSAVEACDAICPGQVAMLHPVYRRVCECLNQMDDFGQVAVLKILERYARACFTDPLTAQETQIGRDFYDSSTPSQDTQQDLSLLIKAVSTLLSSRSSAVVIAACRLLHNLGTASDTRKIVPALLALLRYDADIRYIALTNVIALALTNATIWQEAAEYFLIYPTEPDYVWRLKLEIMALIITPTNSKLLLGELSQYAMDTTDEAFSVAAVQAICKCAQHVPEVGQQCLETLLGHLKSESSSLIGESVIAIRQLVQLNPVGHIRTIKVLVRTLESIVTASARASIFWLVSENLQHLGQVAPDVLRLGVKRFADEEEVVRIQILTLGVKMYVLHCQQINELDVNELNTAIKEADAAHADNEIEAESLTENGHNVVKENIDADPQAAISAALPDTDSMIPKLYAHLAYLARYDSSYDLRDRLRTYKILASSPNWILTKQLLFATKPLPNFVSPSSGKERYALGSSSLLLGRTFKDYQDLPPWSIEVIGAAERNVTLKAPVLRSNNQSSSVPSTRPVTPVVFGAEVQITKPKSKLTGISSLDDFYATSSDDEDEEEDTSASEDEDEDEDEDEEEGDDDDDAEDNLESASEDGSESETDDDSGSDESEGGKQKLLARSER